jgi:hypothetical protein
MALQVIPELPMYTGTGIRTPSGMLIPLGKVACFLSSQGADYYNDSTIANIGCAATLTAAAAQCRTGRADIIVALPGHSETLASAAATTALSAAFVAGTKLVGIGRGTAQPTIRWTHTAASLALSVANVEISGMYLKWEGASGVVSPLVVTGTDVAMIRNRIMVASGASNKCTTGIECGLTSDRFHFIGNQVFGTSGHAITDFLLLDTAVDGIVFRNNTCIASSGTATGFVDVTAACTHLDICDNDLYNEVGSSTACIYFANVASTGICYRNQMAVLSTAGASSTTGIVVAGSSVLVKFNQNYNVDVKGFSGALTPVVTTG